MLSQRESSRASIQRYGGRCGNGAVAGIPTRDVDGPSVVTFDALEHGIGSLLRKRVSIAQMVSQS